MNPGETRNSSIVLLNRYHVLNVLGRGSMGVVFRCFDKVGGIEVAVKTLSPEISNDPGEMEDVRKNFKLVEKLHHPNIAGIKTLEMDAQGGCHLVMECVEGQNLHTWLRKKRKAGTLAATDVLPVLKQTAAALDYAHSLNVIHRDISPGNIMVLADGTVKVLDFGIAAPIHSSTARASQPADGTVTIDGTGPYMAPEQWLGEDQDARTDQYALGVVAYEMFAGQPPFDNLDIEALSLMVLDFPPKPIQGFSSAAWNALARALAKKPAERYASCTVFIKVLESGRPQITAHGLQPPPEDGFPSEPPSTSPRRTFRLPEVTTVEPPPVASPRPKKIILTKLPASALTASSTTPVPTKNKISWRNIPMIAMLLITLASILIAIFKEKEARFKEIQIESQHESVNFSLEFQELPSMEIQMEIENNILGQEFQQLHDVEMETKIENNSFEQEVQKWKNLAKDKEQEVQKWKNLAKDKEQEVQKWKNRAMDNEIEYFRLKQKFDIEKELLNERQNEISRLQKELEKYQLSIEKDSVRKASNDIIKHCREFNFNATREILRSLPKHQIEEVREVLTLTGISVYRLEEFHKFLINIINQNRDFQLPGKPWRVSTATDRYLTINGNEIRWDSVDSDVFLSLIQYFISDDIRTKNLSSSERANLRLNATIYLNSINNPNSEILKEIQHLRHRIFREIPSAFKSEAEQLLKKE